MSERGATIRDETHFGLGFEPVVEFVAVSLDAADMGWVAAGEEENARLGSHSKVAM